MLQGAKSLFIALISRQESTLLSYLKSHYNVPTSDFAPVPAPAPVSVSVPEAVTSTTAPAPAPVFAPAPAPAPASEGALAPKEALQDQPTREFMECINLKLPLKTELVITRWYSILGNRSSLANSSQNQRRQVPTNGPTNSPPPTPHPPPPPPPPSHSWKAQQP